MDDNGTYTPEMMAYIQNALAAQNQPQQYARGGYGTTRDAIIPGSAAMAQASSAAPGMDDQQQELMRQRANPQGGGNPAPNQQLQDEALKNYNDAAYYRQSVKRLNDSMYQSQGLTPPSVAQGVAGGDMGANPMLPPSVQAAGIRAGEQGMAAQLRNAASMSGVNQRDAAATEAAAAKIADALSQDQGNFAPQQNAYLALQAKLAAKTDANGNLVLPVPDGKTPDAVSKNFVPKGYGDVIQPTINNGSSNWNPLKWIGYGTPASVTIPADQIAAAKQLESPYKQIGVTRNEGILKMLTDRLNQSGSAQNSPDPNAIVALNQSIKSVPTQDQRIYSGMLPNGSMYFTNKPEDKLYQSSANTHGDDLNETNGAQVTDRRYQAIGPDEQTDAAQSGFIPGTSSRPGDPGVQASAILDPSKLPDYGYTGVGQDTNLANAARRAEIQKIRDSLTGGSSQGQGGVIPSALEQLSAKAMPSYLQTTPASGQGHLEAGNSGVPDEIFTAIKSMHSDLAPTSIANMYSKMKTMGLRDEQIIATLKGNAKAQDINRQVAQSAGMDAYYSIPKNPVPILEDDVYRPARMEKVINAVVAARMKNADEAEKKDAVANGLVPAVLQPASWSDPQRGPQYARYLH